MSDVAKNWELLLAEYYSHLVFERSFSPNTVEAYMRDIRQFRDHIIKEFDIAPQGVCETHIESFMCQIYDRGMKASSQARMLSSIRSFYQLLELTGNEGRPTEHIDAPKVGRTLPDTLSEEEVDMLISSVDIMHPQGVRNRAMLETLYSCGIRVSELTSLKLNDLFFEDGYIRIVGKGNKQRLVPVSEAAMDYINEYLEQRREQKTDSKSAEILFLNRNGKKLTRVMIFTIIKKSAEAAGIAKNISPHTLRHSFATHLLQGGASIRQVQDMLGHESIQTTEIYTHLDKAHLRRTIEKNHPLSKK